MKKKLFTGVMLIVAVVAVFAASFASAQTLPAKSYHYADITTNIHINTDTTMSVEEAQTFAFTGNFHFGERDVPLNKVSGITDISMTDVSTGAPLTYSASPLNELDPSSWGKFTTVFENGFEKIEWYYNLTDTTHTWDIKYKVHGGIEFDKAYDRLYWNIFSGYSVPIDHTLTTVILPQEVPAANVQHTFYDSAATVASDTYQNGSFMFTTETQPPASAFTIDATWPKGLIDESAFWRDWLGLYWLDILAALVALGSLATGLLWHYFAITRRERPQTVVAQYTPPDNLPPALAEVITKEQVTSKGLTATIVDLAIRGYVTITEIDPAQSAVNKYGKVIGVIIFSLITPLIIMFLVITFAISRTASGGNLQNGVIGSILVLLVAAAVVTAALRIKKVGAKKDYTITAVKYYSADASLRAYEKEYLTLLFSVGDGKVVTTKQLKLLSYDRIAGPAFFKQQKEVRQHIIDEAETEGHPFKKAPKVTPVLASMTSAVFIVIILLSFVVRLALPGWIIPVAVIVVSLAVLITFFYFTTKRTEEGKKENADWLGFKLFLSVTGRDRMQNLTPDMFEKYLPYAMVFGIEKKWAQAFEQQGVAVPAPVWYAGGLAGGPHAGIAQGGFSPATFSASFSSSFSSAFSSGMAGGGGGGGFGGGGAGGGGGGGGGGAH